MSRDVPLTADQRRQFIGTYSVTLPGGERTMLYVVEKGDSLVAQPGNQKESHRMLYRGGNVFAADGMPDFVIRFVIENGHPTKVTAGKADGVIEGVRIE
ncbi:MAG: hypothetical protein ACR2M1_17560 [Gemmatimonadaceae bacterium]